MSSSSIPLPALDVKPTAQPDILQNYTRLAQLQNLQQEQQQRAQMAPIAQQLGQQQIEAGQLDNQTKQIALRDQQAMDAATQQWGQRQAAASATQPASSSSSASFSSSSSKLPDYSDLIPLAIKNGASFNAIKGLQTYIQDQQDKASTIVKNDAQAGLANANALKVKNGLITDAMTGLLNLPDNQLAEGIHTTAQQLFSQGLLDPEHQQMAQQLEQMAQSGNTAQARQKIQLNINGMGAFSKAVTAAQEQEKLKQEQGKSDPTSPFYAPSDKAVAMGTAPGAAQIQAGEVKQAAAKAGAEENARLRFQQAQSGTATTGDDFLGTLPAGMQAQVKATANGDIAIPPPGTRNPQAQALRTAVLTYDPTYTDARYKGKQNFKTSGDAQNIVQLSTAMEHADRAIQNSARAGYAPMLGNKTLESSDSAAYMQDAEFLTGEVGKLVKNGVLSVDEGNKISSGLTSARQTVRDSALNETMDLLGGKARSLFQKYKTSTGQDLPLNEFFDAKSQQRLTKYGIVAGPSQSASPAAQQGNASISVAAPNGKTYTFKDQAAADAFKQKAGIR